MTATPRPGTLGDRIRRAAGLDPAKVDVAHLLEEHRTAAAELRRLRARLTAALEAIDHALEVDTSDLPGGTGSKGIFGDGIRAGVEMTCHALRPILDGELDR